MLPQHLTCIFQGPLQWRIEAKQSRILLLADQEMREGAVRGRDGRIDVRFSVARGRSTEHRHIWPMCGVGEERSRIILRQLPVEQLATAGVENDQKYDVVYLDYELT